MNHSTVGVIAVVCSSLAGFMTGDWGFTIAFSMGAVSALFVQRYST